MVIYKLYKVFIYKFVHKLYISYIYAFFKVLLLIIFFLSFKSKLLIIIDNIHICILSSQSLRASIMLNIHIFK